jgi:hypothetical protein
MGICCKEMQILARETSILREELAPNAAIDLSLPHVAPPLRLREAGSGDGYVVVGAQRSHVKAAGSA